VHPAQNHYATLEDAQNAITSETFTVQQDLQENAFLVGYIITKGNATDLNNSPSEAFMSNAGKFGTAASSSTVQTLQGTYNVSVDPEIVTDATRGALTIRRGSALDADNVLNIQNGAGTETFALAGDGAIDGALIEVDINAAVRTRIGVATGGGGDCVSIGAGAGRFSTKHNNTFIGRAAGNEVVDGNNNTMYGYKAGLMTVNGNQNTCIGSMAENTNAAASNSTSIGYGAIATISNEVVIGNASVTHIRPSGAGVVDLGTTTNRFDTVYSKSFNLSDIGQLGKFATGSLPAAAAGNEGAIAYDTTTQTVKFSDGTTWANI
jgi:hypothetical protein